MTTQPITEFDRFVYIVSHDLQEPLRMVSSFISLINKKHADSLPPDCAEYMGYITENADKMNKMIRSLVDYSRVERNREEMVNIDLTILIEDMLTMFGPEMSLSEAAIELDTLPTIKAQPTLILTLFRNIFQNAFENRNQNPLRLALRVRDEGDRWGFSLEDNGLGIDSDHLGSIFEMFRKVDPKSERVGAGLAISQAIVRKYGGVMAAESTKGKGTKISFSLPK
jgi:two-component system, chemotaxis family, sensor kinase Cph1